MQSRVIVINDRLPVLIGDFNKLSVMSVLSILSTDDCFTNIVLSLIEEEEAD